MTDLLQRFIVQGKLYDELPSRIRASVTVSEYRQRVKETCIRRGLGWAESMASSSCGESDYYDSFMKLYRAEARAFPYQHAAYVCRHQRTTVFKYYTDILFAALRVEKPYHQLPNFTAADIVRVLGIGRNEYIDILNQCRAKRVLWRVNRGLVRDLLPSEPRYFPLEPWWLVCVVNLTVSEFKQLSPEELAALEVAAVPEGVPVSQLDESMLRSLYKRGLVYLDVPVVPEDSFKIPPLEGFVSNKDTQDDSKADPMETLLYSVFVANSERATVQEVAKILDCDLKSVRHALSLACRLGFAHRATPAPAASPPAAGGLLGFPPASTSPGQKPAAPSLLDQLEPALHGPGAGLTHDQLPGGSQPLSMLAADRDMSLPPLDGSWAEGEQTQLQGKLPGAEEAAEEAAGNSQVVAVILDTEATGYLMMGALSPGLKKHSVTLFEAGRVAGDAVITELIDELWASFHAGASFEGEMRSLTDYAASLASMLEFVRDSRGPSAASSIELLRRESLGGLSASAARRVLAHTYCAVVPILLRPPALPLAPNQARPVSFGPTTEAASPWLQLLVAELAGAGAPALVLPAGLCLRQLPPQLQHCTAALLSCWDGQGPFFRSADARASDGAGVPGAPVPNLVHSLGLLWELNTLLQRTAVLVQPLQCEVDYAVPGSARLRVVDVPLPLPQPAAGADARDHRLEVLDALSGERCLICPPARLRQALQESGLESSIGCVRLMSRNDCVMSQGSGSGASVERASSAPCGSQPEAEDEFVPFDVKLGVPLQYLALCQMVCSSARQAQVLSPEGLERQLQGQLKLQRGILDIMARLWPGSNARSEEWEEPSGTTGLIAPSRPLLFDGSTLQSVDLADSLAQSVQGFASLY